METFQFWVLAFLMAVGAVAIVAIAILIWRAWKGGGEESSPQLDELTLRAKELQEQVEALGQRLDQMGEDRAGDRWNIDELKRRIEQLEGSKPAVREGDDSAQAQDGQEHVPSLFGRPREQGPERGIATPPRFSGSRVYPSAFSPDQSDDRHAGGPAPSGLVKPADSNPSTAEERFRKAMQEAKEGLAKEDGHDNT